MRRSFNTVLVSENEVARFNSRWPCSEIRARDHWFDFGSNHDLVDTSIAPDEDGHAAVAMSDDCREWLVSGVVPEWSNDHCEPRDEAHKWFCAESSDRIRGI